MHEYVDKELIQGYFSDYKSSMIWIMIGFSLLSIAIQYFQNLRLSKKIEAYKNDLKKSEIKFSRFNELQIESLKKLYDHIVTFHFKCNNLIDPIFYTHETFISNLKNLKMEYGVCMEYFHRNKIFLTENLVLKIRDIHTAFNLINPYLTDALRTMSELEEHHESRDVQVIYGTAEAEVESIKTRLNNLKEKPGVVNFETEIKSMRDLVEAYFKQLTG